MASLIWSQVQTWRLSQQYLLNRAEFPVLAEVVRRIGGVQAQLMSAAEWSLGARIESLSPEDVQSALWHEHTLIKTWAMRGTLHLLAASDLPLRVAARRAISIHRPPSYYTITGRPPKVWRHHQTVPNVLARTVTRNKWRRRSPSAARPELPCCCRVGVRC
jgi:hypothetical protein